MIAVDELLDASDAQSDSKDAKMQSDYLVAEEDASPFSVIKFLNTNIGSAAGSDPKQGYMLSCVSDAL